MGSINIIKVYVYIKHLVFISFFDHITAAIITIDIIAKVGAILRPTNSAQNPVKKKNAITDANNHKIIFKNFMF